MSALEIISKDLDWRESELGSLKILLNSRDISPQQRRVILRAAWAMLYAHYEGFVKFSLTVFYDEIKKKAVACGALPIRTKVLAFEAALQKIRKLPTLEMLEVVQNFPGKHLSSEPTFPEVETKSNLWPDLLTDLLFAADIKPDQATKHRIKLNTLVHRRNEIAHGKQHIIEEIGYYASFENAVYELMYDLAYQIDERLKQPPYT